MESCLAIPTFTIAQCNSCSEDLASELVSFLVKLQFSSSEILPLMECYEAPIAMSCSEVPLVCFEAPGSVWPEAGAAEIFALLPNVGPANAKQISVADVG